MPILSGEAPASPSATAKRVLAATVGILTLAPCVDLLFGTPSRKFALAASDAFYYLVVARNIVTLGRSSFDGERLTNGYHPIWQGCCAIFYALVRVLHVDEAHSLGLALLAGVCLVALAAYAAGLSLLDDRGRLSVFYLALPVGFATLVYLPVSLAGWDSGGRPIGSVWGAVNGMETALTIACYAAVLFVYTRAERGRRYPFLLGAALSALALARLDHAVFPAILIVGLAAFDRANFRAHAIAGAVFGASIVLYLAVNHFYFGIAMPISGALKSTFPDVTSTNRSLFKTLFSSPSRLALTHAQRGLQLIVPALFAFVHFSWGAFARVRKRGAQLARIDLALWLTAPGVLLLAAYDYFFVPKLNQGFWYFPISNLYVSLVCVRALHRRTMDSSAMTRQALPLGVLIGLCTAASYFFLLQPVGSVGEGKGAFYFEQGPRLRAFYAGKPAKMVEFDDGIVAFSSGIPAMSGMGLALDTGAIDAAGGIGFHRTDRSSLLDLGIKRGFTRFCTFSYSGGRLSKESSDRDIRRAYRHLIGNQARHYTLSVEYASADGKFSIIEAHH